MPLGSGVPPPESAAGRGTSYRPGGPGARQGRGASVAPSLARARSQSVINGKPPPRAGLRVCTRRELHAGGLARTAENGRGATSGVSHLSRLLPWRSRLESGAGVTRFFAFSLRSLPFSQPAKTGRNACATARLPGQGGKASGAPERLAQRAGLGTQHGVSQGGQGHLVQGRQRIVVGLLAADDAERQVSLQAVKVLGLARVTFDEPKDRD
jgi:hypothetical protein